MRVLLGIGSRVAIDAISLRARVSHGGMRVMKGRRSNKDRGCGLEELRAVYRMSQNSRDEAAFCDERSGLRPKMRKEHKKSFMRSMRIGYMYAASSPLTGTGSGQDGICVPRPERGPDLISCTPGKQVGHVRRDQL
jgi:hypothetical protein